MVSDVAPAEAGFLSVCGVDGRTATGESKAAGPRTEVGAAPGGGSSAARRVLRRGPGGDLDPRTEERVGGGGGGG